ncbi:hypothetical protein C0995_014993 [Termitomyces sp. Mi166|nr:hypothetical protein C0995_014993 [Termitomyces sp. Mi166\
MLNHLFHGSVGFHNGVRISAAMLTGLMVLSISLMKPRLPPKKTGPAVPIKEFMQDIAYLFCIIGGPLWICALFFPFFFLQLDAINHGVDQDLAFYYISVMNAASIFGRIMATYYVPKVGVFNLHISFTLAMAVLIYVLGAIKTLGGFFVFAVLYGFFSGGGIALVPVMLGSLAKDVSEIGARIGIVFAFTDFLSHIRTVATAIAGALLTSEFHWWRPIIFEGTMMAASAAFFFVSRVIVSKRKGTQFV